MAKFGKKMKPLHVTPVREPAPKVVPVKAPVEPKKVPVPA